MRLPFSIYVHLPYCSRRCPYCDFNTYVVTTVPEDRYVSALAAEAAHASTSPVWASRRIATVFFGGGTPSLFSPSSIGRLLATFDDLWGIDAGAEITLEANPGSLEGGGQKRLAGFRSAGVNRLSLGAQSFDSRHLATLGRAHGAGETEASYRAARRAGFENVSIDLIYGVPGQSVEDWEQDLARTVELAPDHVSAYGLTYEEGTPLTGMKKAGLVTAADEHTELAMLRAARERLAGAGLAPYEISNYARPARQSRHNLAYWTWQDYLGLGAGAHGFASAPEPDPAVTWGRRYANRRLPESYMSAAPGAWHASEEELSREMAMAEFLLVGLRLAEGIDTHAFADRFGVSFETAAPRATGLLAGALLERRGERVALSARGLELADSVIATLAAG